MRKFYIMYIKENLNDMEKDDLIKICQIIKKKQINHDMIYVNFKGTYIDFDKLEDRVIFDVYEYVKKRIDEIIKDFVKQRY